MMKVLMTVSGILVTASLFSQSELRNRFKLPVAGHSEMVEDPFEIAERPSSPTDAVGTVPDPTAADDDLLALLEGGDLVSSTEWVGGLMGREVALQSSKVQLIVLGGLAAGTSVVIVATYVNGTYKTLEEHNQNDGESAIDALNRHKVTNATGVVPEDFNELPIKQMSPSNYMVINGASAASKSGTLNAKATLTIGGSVVMDNAFLGSNLPYSTNYQLFVGGSIEDNGRGGMVSEDFAIASQAEWPDYVFHPDYKLRSLEELEAFILKHKHLPNVPSAVDIKSDGHYSTHKMITSQLQNLEELYLHAIDNENKLIEQDAELIALKERLVSLNNKIEEHIKNLSK